MPIALQINAVMSQTLGPLDASIFDGVPAGMVKGRSQGRNLFNGKVVWNEKYAALNKSAVTSTWGVASISKGAT